MILNHPLTQRMKT